MTVHQQLIDVCRDASESLLTAAEIKRRVIDRFGTNPGSIIPSDHCYNRWNRGIKIRTPLFVRVGTSEYRYVGPGQRYTGLVFGRPRGATTDKVVGEWVDGVLDLYDNEIDQVDDPEITVPSIEPIRASAIAVQPDVPISVIAPRLKEIPLSAKQLDRLYEEYMEILSLEVSEFGCQPTETRHLIGRLGEFYCARLTDGRLAGRVNQHGFDVVTGKGKRVSVKTTAQQKGFVSINPNTIELADELMVLQYGDRDFEVVYHGEVVAAIQVCRLWQGRYELDITKARKLGAVLPSKVRPKPDVTS